MRTTLFGPLVRGGPRVDVGVRWAVLTLSVSFACARGKTATDYSAEMDRDRLVVSLRAPNGEVSGAGGLGGAVQLETSKARTLDRMITYIADHYVDSISRSDVYQLAIEGLIARIDDPYTAYVEKSSYHALTTLASGSYSGIGAGVESHNGLIQIVTPTPGGPAARVGLQGGDRIVEIDGQSTWNWSATRAASALRGNPGTVVRIKALQKATTEPVSISLKRGYVEVSSITQWTMLDSTMGYVRLRVVSQNAARDLMRRIDVLRDRGMRALILDLRDNPGGISSQARRIAELFLDSGLVIVEQRFRQPVRPHLEISERRQRWPDMPIVVLIDQGTASAAEAIVGALQDHDRAVLIGQRTFGKGVTYGLYPLPDGAAMRITTSRWYTPTGRSVGRVSGAQLSRNGGPPFVDAPRLFREPRTVYRSDGGRPLDPGPGILPDIVLGQVESADGVIDVRETRSLNYHKDTVLELASDLLSRAGSPAALIALLSER